jgi:hypothetical protein
MTTVIDHIEGHYETQGMSYGVRLVPRMRRGRVRLRRDTDPDRFGIILLVRDRPRGFGSRDHGFRATVGRGTPPVGQGVSGVEGEAGRIPAFGETLSTGIESH